MKRTIKRLLTIPHGSFFLFGPRGTGKSTWLKQTFPHAYTVNLLEADKFRKLAAQPEHLIELVEGNLDRKIFVIDEVQKLPALLDAVHLLIEKHKGIRFALTGSSARKLRRTGVDLLAGRAIRSLCHPFLAAELGDAFDFGDALKNGLVPLVLTAGRDKRKVLQTYLDLYIREEVLAEGLVRNLGAFTRFLDAVSFSHGSLFNATAIGRECGVNRTSVEGFTSILEDLYLASRISVFTKRAKRNLVTHEKFYFFDAGVFNAVRPCGPFDAPEQMAGLALEGLVYQHLRAWNDYSAHKLDIKFWRTSTGIEVDFVLYGEKEFVAIEVKNSDRIRPHDLDALEAFGKDYPTAKRILLHRGKDRWQTRGILCLPCEEFLRSLIPNKKCFHAC